MENDNNKPETTDGQPAGEQAPADALSRTPDDLEQEQVATETAAANTPKPEEKKLSPFKRLYRRVNIYLLLFLLIAAVAAVIVIVTYLNSQKPAAKINLETQELTQDALKQLANSDASIGDSSQTLTIQGNAIIAGQTLMRGNLSVAGNFQAGGSIQGASITVSGKANLGETQVSSLQVKGQTVVQGDVTARNLSISGTTSLSGPVQASQLTVSRLILSGNASLEVPNHISFTGPTPGRSVSSGVLGSGGSVSINGSDTAGSINIRTGNHPSPGCFTQVTFRQPFSHQPRVIISPVGSGAGLTQYYVDRTPTGFSVCTNNAAPANRTFGFDYFVMG